MKKSLMIIALALALLGGTVAPSVAGQAYASNHVQSHPALFDKTRFLLHMGLAYFAFHHFVYAKWKAGAFKSGASHRTLNIAKAAIAVLFTYHELKKAYDIAKGSHSATLHALIAPINAVLKGFNSAYSKLKNGQFSDAIVSGLSTTTGTLSGTASKAGYAIKDIPVTIPGA
jgi:hypothetical protein